MLALFIIICCSMYYDIDAYNDLIYLVPQLKEPTNCSLTLFLFDAIVPMFDYAIQVYVKPTRKTLLVYYIVHVIISIYACVGLDIIYKNDVYEANIVPNERYDGVANTMKTLFWLIILPLFMLGPLALIAICIFFIFRLDPHERSPTT